MNDTGQSGTDSAETKARRRRATAELKSFTKDENYRRIVRGGAWAIAGAVLTRGANLANGIIVARLLGRTEYGKVGIVQSTVWMLSLVAGLGLGVTATRFIAMHRHSDPSRASRAIEFCRRLSILAGGIMAASLVAAAPALASHSLREPELATPIRLASLILLFGSLNGFQVGALAGFEAFPLLARTNLRAAVWSVPATIGLTLAWGVNGVILALGSTAALNCYFNGRALSEAIRLNRLPKSGKLQPGELPALLHFSLPTFLSGLVYGAAAWAVSAILVRSPGGLGEMGLYNAANQWASLVQLLPGMMAPAMLAALSNLHGNSDRIGYRSVVRLSFLVNGGIAALVALTVGVASPLIFRLYGGQFEPAQPVLVVLVIVAFLMAVNNVFVQYIASSGKMWLDFGFNILWALALLILASLLVPRGALGVAAAYLGAYTLHSVWQGGYALYLIRGQGETPRVEAS